MSDRLSQLCQRRIRAARGFAQGEVYRRLRLRSRWYDSFDLIWDAPTRIVVLARGWTPEALRALREDMLHLHATLPQLQVHKKLHLILFHSNSDNASEQPWPTGVSFSPIALDPATDLANPPPFIGPKLDSILGIPQGALPPDDVAAAGDPPPNWRLFLKNDRDVVVQKIRDLSDARDRLPADLRSLVDRLLSMAESEGPDLQEQVTHLLNRLWEAYPDETAESASGELPRV